MHAGGEGIDPSDTMRQPLVNEEIKRAVSDRGLVSETGFGELFKHLICPDRTMGSQQDLQRPASDRCQTRSARNRQGLCPSQNAAAAIRMVVCFKGQAGFGLDIW